MLTAASLAIEARERVGLVGRNGSGKSTLARILAGAEAADDGEVIRSSGLQVAYLEQEPRFDPGATAVQVVLGGLSDWQTAIDTHARVSAAIEAGDGDIDALLEQQAAAEARVDELGGWEKRHEAEAVLGHVGIEDPDASTDTMSGGERRRVALARLLVADPDLAILDEPTNHLDVPAIEWLERWFLDRFRGALILVTHDRFLLDRLVTRTLEVENGEVHAYAGGWEAYLVAKAEREAHAERVEANRRNYLRRELEWLRRSPKARSTKQKARVERIEAVASQTGPERERTADIALGHVRSGKTVLDVEHLAVDIGGERLVEDLTMGLSKGDRIGIVGPNGCGKTSLLRVLTGQVPPSAGRVTLGKNTKIAYLDQSRSGLDDGATVFDAVAEGRGHVEVGGQEIDVRSYLERFLFTRQEQRKKVGVLSGGERARVALARTLREGANLVVLDEPTNDLDVSTLAALEDALLSYPGTVLIVTHDRWLLDRVATSVLVFDEGRVTLYPGGYSSYVSLRARRRDNDRTPGEKQERATATEPKNDRPRKLTYAERIELDGLLDKVDEAESLVSRLEGELGDPAFYSRPENERSEVLEQFEAAKTEAERLAQRWTKLEELRDAET